MLRRNRNLGRVANWSFTDCHGLVQALRSYRCIKLRHGDRVGDARRQSSAPRLEIDEQHLNAFAAGRNPDQAVLILTTGLRTYLSNPELGAVIGYERCHV